MKLTFPKQITHRTIFVFSVLVVVAVVEATVAVPSWHLVYPLLEGHLRFLSSFFAAAEQFASGTVAVSVMTTLWIYRPDARKLLAVFVVALLLANTVTNITKVVAGRARPNHGVLMEKKTARKITVYLKEHDNSILRPVPGDYWLWMSKGRPGLEPLLIFKGEFDPEKLNPFGEYDSFPSGHATSALVLATFLALVFPRGRVLWYCLGFGCALARVRFRRHYPADIIMGGAVGWFTVHVVFSWLWPFRLGERLAPWVEKRIGKPGAESGHEAMMDNATPRKLAMLLMVLVICIGSSSCIHSARGQANPVSAMPCDTCIVGVSNFAEVSPALWRGSQPSTEGFRSLKGVGLRTVVSFRAFHDDQDLIVGTGLNYVSIPAHPWHPEEEDLAIFLKVLEDRNNWPVFVHCAFGEDRTGYAVATYRIVEQGWPSEDAIEEMKAFGFNQVWLANPILLRNLDAEKLRARVKALVPIKVTPSPD